MPRWVLECLDVALLTAHIALIGFNVLGWLWRATRLWNLLCLTLTTLSWLVLGAFYGAGYCVLTDWHWRVLRALEREPSEGSFIQYVVRLTTGWSPPESLVNPISAGVLLVSVVGSVSLTLRDSRLKRASSP